MDSLDLLAAVFGVCWSGCLWGWVGLDWVGVLGAFRECKEAGLSVFHHLQKWALWVWWPFECWAIRYMSFLSTLSAALGVATSIRVQKLESQWEIWNLFSLFFSIREPLQVFGKALSVGGQRNSEYKQQLWQFWVSEFWAVGWEMSLGSILSAPLDGIIYSVEEFARPMRKLKFCCTSLAVSLSDRPLSIGLWGSSNCWILFRLAFPLFHKFLLLLYRSVCVVAVAACKSSTRAGTDIWLSGTRGNWNPTSFCCPSNHGQVMAVLSFS